MNQGISLECISGPSQFTENDRQPNLLLSELTESSENTFIKSIDYRNEIASRVSPKNVVHLLEKGESFIDFQNGKSPITDISISTIEGAAIEEK